MKIDKVLSYGIARKIFEDKVHQQGQTYAEMATSYPDELASEEAYELEKVKEHTAQAKQSLDVVEKLIRAREEQEKLKKTRSQCKQEKK
jgi:hypothetical protein